MPQLSDFDERLVHQIPEPLGVVGIEHPHWRESYFFVTHGPAPGSDVVVVAMATYPPRAMLDALVLGRGRGRARVPPLPAPRRAAIPTPRPWAPCRWWSKSPSGASAWSSTGRTASTPS